MTTKKQRAGSGTQSNAVTNAGLIEIQIQYRAVADLVLDSRNPRQHSQRQVNQIADSIQEFGFVMPVVVDHKGHVVIGHGGFWRPRSSKCRVFPLSRSGICRRRS